MANQPINIGTAADDGTGDTLRDAGGKINANFTELYAREEMASGDATKLAAIEAGATADQTGAEIKAAYEAEADTNAYDDAAVAKLAAIEAGATADQTGAEIKVLLEAEADTNFLTDAQIAALSEIRTAEQLQDLIAAMFQGGTHTNISYTYQDATGVIDSVASTGGASLTQEEVEDFVGGLVMQGTGISVTYDDVGNVLSIALAGESYTTAEKNKLAAIEAGATADQTGAEIKAAYEAEADTNAYDDAAVTKVGLSVVSNVTGITGATAIANQVIISQANYDAIGTPDANTIYHIVG